MSHTGIAIAPNALYLENGDVIPLATRVPGSREWPALHEALATLTGGTRGGWLTVTILPPLTQLRALRLPKMRADDTNAILSRSLARYFPTVREPHAVASARLAAAENGEYAYTVVATPLTLLAAVEDAARNTGWTVTRFAPAYVAWARAGTRLAPQGLRTNAQIVVEREDGGGDVIQVSNGVPREVRRLRADTESATSGTVRIASPGSAAARFGKRASALNFVTPAIAQQRALRVRQWSIAAAALIVIGIGAAAGGLFVHAKHELESITAARAAIRPKADAAAHTQAMLATFSAPAQTLAGIEERGVRWSAVVSDLADYLPHDAFIESLRGSNDSLTIDGAAETGARVFQTVAASSSLTRVVPSGPIRRDATPDSSGTTLERFTLVAHVPNATALVPPPKRRNAK